MDAGTATQIAPVPESTDARPWRAVGWIAVTIVLFVGLLVATLYTASRVTNELGIASPEREHFAVLQALLFSASLLIAIPLAGRLLGQVRSGWPGAVGLLPFLLATVASYLLFEDVRSGHVFDTDHALPEIFVPIAIALLGSAHVAERLAATAFGRRAWSWFSVAAAIVLLVCVALTLAKVTARLGGMFQLDSPMTFAALITAMAYAIGAMGRVLVVRRG